MSSPSRSPRHAASPRVASPKPASNKSNSPHGSHHGSPRGRSAAAAPPDSARERSPRREPVTAAQDVGQHMSDLFGEKPTLPDGDLDMFNNGAEEPPKLPDEPLAHFARKGSGPLPDEPLQHFEQDRVPEQQIQQEGAEQTNGVAAGDAGKDEDAEMEGGRESMESVIELPPEGIYFTTAEGVEWIFDEEERLPNGEPKWKEVSQGEDLG